jgi:hypothetical protein
LQSSEVKKLAKFTIVKALSKIGEEGCIDFLKLISKTIGSLTILNIVGKLPISSHRYWMHDGFPLAQKDLNAS